MSVIGQQIRKYRMAKQITQEQLGQLVGVTTQAVSKWERGGTPDAELLPALSEALGVSIDALFGREEQSFTFSLLKKICHMPSQEAFRYVFDVCWAMMIGTIHEARSMPDDRLLMDMDHTSFDGMPHPDFARIMYDEGMINARFSPDLRHFFLLLEPKTGLRAQLSQPEQLRQVFAALADDTRLKIIFYMYTRLNTPIATSLISKNMGLPVPEVDRHMDILCRQGIVKRTVIATSGGEIYSYMFDQEDAVIAMLCFADALIRREDPNFVWSMSRTKPLMESTDG